MLEGGGEYEQENICTAYTVSWIQPATSIPHQYQRRLHSFCILQLGRGQRTGGVAVARWLHTGGEMGNVSNVEIITHN